MQDSVLNLCRVKLRDQQRLDRQGFLEEYPQYPHEMDAFKDKVVPRGGNAGGGGQPGWILKCKGWQTDPNASIYFTVQGHAWAPICDAIGKPEWKTDPAYTTPKARQPHIDEIFATIEDWLKDKTKFEAVDVLRKFDIPCAPVLTMKEILTDKSLIESGTITEVKHKTRGSYWTVGSPIKFSDMKPEITGSPLLGEHSDEVLASLGYTAAQIKEMHDKEVI
jgi:formyl-CoA transferase